MEKPLFPSEYMRITQGYNEGTHVNSFAIDNAGKDSGISDIYAPYTGIIKKIYQNDANEVWLESLNEVEYPDGTKDYMTMLFAHNNDVSNLFVGKIIKQGENFYKEGTKGNASGNHCHMECGRGKFTGSGWHKNNSGFWSINNGVKPESCLWINDTIKIMDNHSYQFKKLSPKVVEKENSSSDSESQIKESVSTPDQSKDIEKEDKKEKNVLQEQTENKEKEDKKEEPKKESSSKELFTFIAPKTDLYGVYLKENQQLSIKELS